MTSRGFSLDLIDSIINDLAICSHARESIDTLNNKISSGDIVDDETKESILESIKNLNEIWSSTLMLRRKKMDMLFNLSENNNKSFMWCILKHALASFGTAVEVYEAVFNDETETILKDNTMALANIISMSLGFEPFNCLRCLDDKLNINKE